VNFASEFRGHFYSNSYWYYMGTSTYYVTRYSKISDPPSSLVTKNRTNLYVLTMVRNKSLTPPRALRNLWTSPRETCMTINKKNFHKFIECVHVSTIKKCLYYITYNLPSRGFDSCWLDAPWVLTCSYFFFFFFFYQSYYS
jgi:hypothetical protein